MSRKLLFMFAALLSLTACYSGPDPDPATRFGHGFKDAVITGPGLLLGSWAPQTTAAMMDAAALNDNRRMEKSAMMAPTGQQMAWSDPDTGSAGSIVAVRDSYDKNGAYCRDFQQTLTLNGEQLTGQPRACQQADGSWKIMK